MLSCATRLKGNGSGHSVFIRASMLTVALSMQPQRSSICATHMQHIAEEDQFVPKDAQATVKSALAGVSPVTVHSYPGVDHAFARIGGAHYDAKAAETANARTLDFFKTNLG